MTHILKSKKTQHYSSEPQFNKIWEHLCPALRLSLHLHLIFHSLNRTGKEKGESWSTVCWRTASNYPLELFRTCPPKLVNRICIMRTTNSDERNQKTEVIGEKQTKLDPTSSPVHPKDLCNKVCAGLVCWKLQDNAGEESGLKITVFNPCTTAVLSVPQFHLQVPCISFQSTPASFMTKADCKMHVERQTAIHNSFRKEQVQFRGSVVSNCDPMNHSTPGLPVHHQLPGFTQTQVHWVGDAIQPSPLSSPSPAPNPSQHQSLPMSQLFAWGGQSTVWALASYLPKDTQDRSPLEWTGWISLQSKGLSRVFSNTTVQKHQFFGAQLSSQSNSHVHTWLLEKP